MQGLMMQQQLMINDLIEHAANNHGSCEIFSRECDGTDHVKKLANALLALGVNSGDRSDFTDDGWFITGDVAALHPSGRLEITDRSKDVIKSGGEWISSIEVENAAMNHPGVAMAACIGAHHVKWQERPILIVQPMPGATPGKDEIKKEIEAKCAKWWLPDGIFFTDALPIGPTGKILKKDIKEDYKNFSLTD